MKLYAITHPDDQRRRVFYEPGTNKFDALGGFLDGWEGLIYTLEIIEFSADNKKGAREIGEIWKEARGLDTKKFAVKEVKIEGYKISLSKLER